MRIAAAPISWGVCEVPGWGHQLSPDQVLTEMAAVGVAATELGPEGFIKRAVFEEFLSRGFHPLAILVVRHRRSRVAVNDITRRQLSLK